jgi:hypothetical protein
LLLGLGVGEGGFVAHRSPEFTADPFDERVLEILRGLVVFQVRQRLDHAGGFPLAGQGGRGHLGVDLGPGQRAHQQNEQDAVHGFLVPMWRLSCSSLAV